MVRHCHALSNMQARGHKKATPPAAGGGGGEHGDDVGGGGGTQGVWHSLNTPTSVLRCLLGSCLCTRVSTPSSTA